MEEEAMHLSSTERSKIQNEKQIYCLLRLMNYIEKFYSTDKIDQSTYKNEITKLLEKYTKFSQITPGYNLEDFIKKYSVPHEEISWAKYVIEKGVEGQQGKETFFYMQATATFIEVNDVLNLASDNPVVGQIRASLEKLQLILKKIYQKLGPEFTQRYTVFNRLMEKVISEKTSTESLTVSQFKEIKLCVESMYNMMSAIMQN